jgi:hypothetical protein
MIIKKENIKKEFIILIFLYNRFILLAIDITELNNLFYFKMIKKDDIY